MTERQFARLLKADTARISKCDSGKMFLIIGFKRNTKDDAGQWLKDGKPIDFDYLAERCVASGRTMCELEESAREYKRLQSITTGVHRSARGYRGCRAPASTVGSSQSRGCVWTCGASS
jgi:hypothetical protein